MLTLVVNLPERWDETANVFVKPETVILHLEHSLKAMREWEAMFHKPFNKREKRTALESNMYLLCMHEGDPIPIDTFNYLTPEQTKVIEYYMTDPHTAYPKESKKEGEGTIYKSYSVEHIYSWMFELGIPLECETWHINNLMGVINCMAKRREAANNKGKKNRPKNNNVVPNSRERFEENQRRRRELNME